MRFQCILFNTASINVQKTIAPSQNMHFFIRSQIEFRKCVLEINNSKFQYYMAQNYFIFSGIRFT